MKKAAQKAPPAPVSLGTKRTCPDCGTKFYDFAKSEIICPKCESQIDPSDLSPTIRYAPEPKKAPPKVVPDGEEELASGDVPIDSAEVLEDMDDLDGGDVVEDLEVDDDEEDEN